MRISLVRRAASACVAATLAFSFSLAPSSARMGGPAGRPAFGPGHLSHFAPRGLNRRFDFDRFGPDRFGRFGFNRFGFNRFGFSRFGGNQLAVGGWGGGGWGWGWGGWGWGGWGGGDWGGFPVSTGPRSRSSSATARRSLSISAPIRREAMPAPGTEEAASSTSLSTITTANMLASDKAHNAD
jgi:hypothetical protein